jgi:hypothetical protein
LLITSRRSTCKRHRNEVPANRPERALWGLARASIH